MASWKPLLDKYEISAVMVEPADAPNTYERLLQSPNWVPFYDDGRIVMFGRADAPADGPRVFQGEQARRRSCCAYRDEASGRRRGAAAQPDVLDRRRVSESDVQPAAVAHRVGAALAAGRAPRSPASRAAAVAFRTPLTASWRSRRRAPRLRTARTTGLHSGRLKDAYRYLMVQENAMLEGVPITPDNAERILHGSSRRSSS